MSGRRVHVSGYHRSNGTYVRGYARTVPSGCSSRSSSANTTGQRRYVDNEQNRCLGRVGKPHGSHVLHKDGTVTVTTPVSTPCYTKQSFIEERKPQSVCGMLPLRPSKTSFTTVSPVPHQPTVHTTSTVRKMESRRQVCTKLDTKVNSRKVCPTHKQPTSMPEPQPHLMVHQKPHLLSQQVATQHEMPSEGGCFVLGKCNHAIGTSRQSVVPRKYPPNACKIAQETADKHKSDSPNPPHAPHCIDDKKPIPKGVPLQHHSPEEHTHEQVDQFLTKLGLKTDEVPTTIFDEYPQPEMQKPAQKTVERSHGADLKSTPCTEQMTPSEQNGHCANKLPTTILVGQVLEQTVPSGTQRAKNQLKVEARPNNPPSTHVSPAKQIISYEELHLESVIGCGSYGEVHKGTLRGRPVAYKKLKLQQIMTRKRKQRFEAEVTILAALNHPNIVQMFGIVDEEGKYGIVMEYLIRTLYRAIFTDDTEFPKGKKKKVVSQIGSALAYLHTYKEGSISHGDLKSANILLDEKDGAKLADFGLSTLKNATTSSQSTVAGVTHGGTPRYSAPEVLRGEILTMKQRLQADLYSLGIVVFEVIVKEEAFEDLNVMQLQANVGHGTMRPPVSELSRCVADLLIRCWDRDAQSRPTSEQFVEEWYSLAF